MIKAADWYELTLHGVSMNELPIPADHRLWIEEFQAYEGTNLSAVEICRQTQIPFMKSDNYKKCMQLITGLILSQVR